MRKGTPTPRHSQARRRLFVGSPDGEAAGSAGSGHGSAVPPCLPGGVPTPPPGICVRRGSPTPGSLMIRGDYPICGYTGRVRVPDFSDPGSGRKIRPRWRDDSPASDHLLGTPCSGCPFLRAEKIIIIHRREHRLCDHQKKIRFQRENVIPKTNSPACD